jgi:hypothetical protein
MKKLMAMACTAALACLAGAASGQVVISQVYGGGGNSGAPFNRDFVELFNKGNTPVDLTGYSVQYSAATSTTWTPNVITSGTIPANGYFLVQLAGGATGAALPTPDAAPAGASNMSATAGKVALVSNSTALSGCPTGAPIVDLVGFGATAVCFETASAAGGSNTLAIFRASDGCTDTNNNASNFSAAAPAPRNSASPTLICSSSTPPSGVGSSSPDICPGQSTLVTITVTQGTSPASPITSVVGDSTSIGGGGGEIFFNDGTNGDAVAGDNIWSTTLTVFSATTGGRPIPTVITDALGRQGNATATVNVAFCGMGGFLSATPVCTGGGTLVTFAVTPAQGPTSTGITATADLSSLGGSSSQQLFDDGTNGDAVTGDNIFSYNLASTTATPGAFAISGTAQDAEARNVARNATVFVGACTNSSSTLVISAIYGAGGNVGSNFSHDYVELFNRGTAPISLNGMSIQYASGETDTNGLGVSGTGRMHILSSAATLQPGQYYLVKMAGTAAAIPADDTTGLVAMSADRGTIALVNGTVALGTNSCGNTSILDMVGYGYSDYVANPAPQASRGYCREGDFHAPTLTATTGLIRRNGGCWDTDNNGLDFVVYTPAPRNSATALNPCGGDPCPGNLCGDQDYNGDGDFGTDQDIEAFFACLGGNCCATCFCQGSDFNGDGDFGTDQDIESFFRVLGGGSC